MSFCARSPTPTPAADSEGSATSKDTPSSGQGMGAAFPQYVGREFGQLTRVKVADFDMVYPLPER